MAHVELVREQVQGEDLKNLYKEITASGFGAEFPLNFFTSQGVRPDILESTWNLTQTLLLQGQLPATLKQMIIVAISNQNDCRYCKVTHNGALEAMGVPQEIIQSCSSDPELTGVPEPHKQIVNFALKAAQNPKGINEDDIAKLHEVGVQEGELVEIMMLAAFTNFINTWADASGIPLDGNG